MANAVQIHDVAHLGQSESDRLMTALQVLKRNINTLKNKTNLQKKQLVLRIISGDNKNQ
jgi:hypothetical protein